MIKKIQTSNSFHCYQEKGYLLEKRFFDVENEIEPIINKISKIIEIVARDNNVKLKSKNFNENYSSLLGVDRKLGSLIYDAVKQIPEFVSLISSQKVINLMKKYMGYEEIGLAHGGVGIRINNPKEEQYRAPWHQEFPAQLRSPRGIVLWSPLVNVTQDMGPVEILESSHKEGIQAVYVNYEKNNQNKAYCLELVEKDKLQHAYRNVSPLTAPGDVILMDFLTIHKSGNNVSNNALWSMQTRYFSFQEPEGKKIGWAGGYNSGSDFATYFPGLVKE